MGDVILSIDGKVLENGRQFDVNLYRRAVGETVTLEVARGETRFKTNVRVVEREDPEGRFANLVTPEKKPDSPAGCANGRHQCRNRNQALENLMKSQELIVAKLSDLDRDPPG